ncbi:MAG: hypothetical protein ACM31G_07225 [Flavobacteriales bacterium]
MNDFPKACTKDALQKKLNAINGKWVREEMNKAIALYRKIDLDEAKKKRTLLKPECKMVLEVFGEG